MKNMNSPCISDKLISLEELEKQYKKCLERTENSDIIEELVRNICSIGDFSREMENREYIGEIYSNFMFSVMKDVSNIDKRCVFQSLRVIGNCCIDHAKNRKRVLELCGEDILMDFLEHEDSDIYMVSLTSLLNLCMDCDEATERLNRKKAVSRILKTTNSRTNFDILARIIGWLMSKEEKHYDTDCFIGFLSFLQSYPDNVADAFSIILSFLPQIDIQSALIQSEKLYDLLEYFYRMVPYQEHFNSENKGLISMLINLFGEIAANNDFSEYILNNKLIMDMLLKHLEINSFYILILCSCVMLGNLARTDKTCIYFVHELKLYEKLINIINLFDNPKVIYSSSGFLKNLSIPKDNKSIIGEAGGIKLCTKLFTFDSVKPILYTAVCILRQLIIDDGKNASFFVDSGIFMQLLELRKGTDDHFIIMESSRVVSSMIRTINLFKLFDIEKKMLVYPDYENIFKDMIVQTQYHVIRTEAIFALALISRSFCSDFKKIVFNLLQDEVILNILIDLGKTGTKDLRDNIRVLFFSINREFQNDSINAAFLLLGQCTD
ncbi:hypothetical protein T552_03192 [Pneumocystis carinii B80]|uniref:UNC-45/Cro1/She4 central domain-containing protein n=1 Tax=Pneumocystis carinii (strain B80) TaxID=1408658 RepID=A0A0W4ZC82_PNEC8|nr:hypothetical protein T552_03192 [Pneumocystis carinii B80]KTW25918.1 hypothetical protein T552_03192 [Pneumocystis carinii B80]